MVRYIPYEKNRSNIKLLLKKRKPPMAEQNDQNKDKESKSLPGGNPVLVWPSHPDMLDIS